MQKRTIYKILTQFEVDIFFASLVEEHFPIFFALCDVEGFRDRYRFKYANKAFV